jgi:hypothetical protein
MLIAPSELTRTWRLAATWMDFVIIPAIVLVLSIAAATHYAHIRTESRAAFISADPSGRISYPTSNEALLKARIGIARRIGT